MIDSISAKAETLLDQASMTAGEYLAKAVRAIDAQFGEGYAAQNPALVGAFMAAAAQDFHTAMTVAQNQRQEGALNAISDSLDRVARAIEAR